MYAAQMGVEMALQALVLGSNTAGFDSTTFNEAPTNPGRRSCSTGETTKLSQLRSWRAQYHNTNLGLWHLMTNCYPPSGTVGIAYVGALCHQYGVGWSNFIRNGGTWEVLAHEIDHNFGAGHTFDFPNAVGGIMDYGDGLYQGVYQFHPVHRDEVCSEIQSSMRGNRGVQDCWAAVADPTPRPTAPTPRPTAPTPRPTAPTPRPTQVIPTPRPTNTPRPTLEPTQKPIIAGGTIFQWRETGTYGDCSVSCGSGFRTEVVQCVAYDLATCTSVNLNTADTSTCTTDDFSSCDSQVVSNGFCMNGCKPAPNTITCNAGSCGGNTCGNGILNKDEYCDTALDACCNDSCTGWRTTPQCQATNCNVEAAVMDYGSSNEDARLFTFQGGRFAIYPNMGSNTPTDVFPLSMIEGLDASFQDGVDAAASFYDEMIFLFKDDTWVVVDLGEMAQLGGLRDVDDYFNLNSQFSASGKVDAVLSYYWTLDMISDDLTAEFDWQTSQQGPSNQATLEWENLAAFPAEIAPGQINAAVRNPQDGRLRFYKGCNSVTWREGSSDVTVAETRAWPSEDYEPECQVENCAQCNTANTARCDTCIDGYRRKRRGRLCKPPKNFVDITFDDADYTTALMQHTLGHASGSADNGGWGYTGTIVDGAFGYGLHLDGNQEFQLQPHTFPDVTSNWKISFMWKPEQWRRERMLTIYRTDRTGYIEEFMIDFAHESTTG